MLLIITLLISLAQTRLVHTERVAGTEKEVIRVYQAIDKHGFVLTTADEKQTVIGYSENGMFDAEQMPVAMQDYLQFMAERLASGARLSTMSFEPVGPVMSTKWGQDRPYNLYTPIVGGETTPTGCVATATCQIMNVHQCPNTYNWSILRDSYRTSDTDESAQEVARLMHEVGVSIGMDYSPNGSGAQSYDAMKQLYNTYGYDKGIFLFPLEYMRRDSALVKIHKNLQQGRPVYLSAYTVLWEGHAFVCDGMDEKGFLHINWGWNGYYDGYFAITSMTPAGQGTGGSASGEGFTVGIDVGCDIRPNEGGDIHPTITADRITLDGSKWGKKKSETFGWTMTNVYNQGACDVRGKFGLIISQNQQVVKTIDLTDIYGNDYFKMNTGFGSYPLGHSFHSDELANGNYEVVLGVRSNDSEAYYPIMLSALGEVRYSLRLTADSVILGEMPYDLPTELDHVQDIYRNEKHQWSIISSYWDNSYTSPVDSFISGYLGSAEKESIVGTYTISGSNTAKTGVWSGVSLKTGNSSNYQTYPAQGGMLTVDKNPQNRYYDIYLHLETQQGELNRHLQIGTEYLVAMSQGSSWWDQSVIKMKNDHYISHSWEEAVGMGDTLMPIYVHGIATEIEGTTIQMGEIACPSVADIKGTMYPNDTVVIVGYVCPNSHQLKNGRVAVNKHPDYSIRDLEVTNDADQVRISWSGLAPNYRAVVKDEKGTTVYTQDGAEEWRELTLEKGAYTAYVMAVTPGNKPQKLGEMSSVGFLVEGATALEENAQKMVAEKQLIEGRLYIRKGERIYSIYGF